MTDDRLSPTQIVNELGWDMPRRSNRAHSWAALLDHACDLYWTRRPRTEKAA